MAVRKIEKGSEEWQFFKDFWTFREKYHDTAEEPDEWYDELVRAGEIIVEKYKNTDFSHFARSLVFSHFEDIEMKCKKGKTK